MDIPTKNRSELKTHFVRNAIPTEKNFADLIDAALNQKDDGIAKQPGDPFSIEASGDTGSQKKAINFYQGFSDQKPAWVLSLNPRADPSDPATAQAGFSVGTSDGMSRLFIDQANGRVGIGTTKPADQLTVEGGDVRITGGKNRRLKIVSDQFWAGIELVARQDGEAGHPHIDFTHGELDTPTFGIRLFASSNDELVITGSLVLQDELSFGARTRQMINLWHDEYGIGVQNSTHYFRSASHFAWYQAGSHHASALNAGGGTLQMVIRKSGHVGIGTSAPTEKLHVVGEARITGNASFANSEIGLMGRGQGWAGMAHRDSKVNGSHKTSYGFLQNGRGTITLINKRSGAGHIGFCIDNENKMVLNNSGNLGVGTNNPRQRLDVQGRARIALGVIQNGDVAITTTSDLGLYSRISKRSIRISSTNAPILFFTDGGANGVGSHQTLSIEIDRTVRINGQPVVSSSRDVKKDVQPLCATEYRSVLDQLKDTPVFRYRFKSAVTDTRLRLGVIAEECPQEILDDTGKAVSLMDFMGFLLAAVKAQQTRIEDLRAQVESLKGPRLAAEEAHG